MEQCYLHLWWYFSGSKKYFQHNYHHNYLALTQTLSLTLTIGCFIHFILLQKRHFLSPSDQIHCVCPDGHNYLDTEYKFKEEGEITEMLVNYFCLPVSFENPPFNFQYKKAQPAEKLLSFELCSSYPHATRARCARTWQCHVLSYLRHIVKHNLLKIVQLLVHQYML